MNTQIKLRKRVNVILPQETLQMIDRVVEHGNRSNVIDKAIRFYIDEIGKANLKMQLKEGAQKRIHRDIDITKEWFFLEKDVWRRKK